MNIASGSYTGDGSTPRTIQCTGVNPNFVFVKGAANVAVSRISTMPANNSKPWTGALDLITGGILSEGTGLFTVGSDARVNASGTTYYWLALECQAEDSAVGSYVGNLTDNRDVVASLAFQPDFVLILQNDIKTPVWRTAEMTGDAAIQSDALLNVNWIQVLQAAGFQIGSSSQVNGSAKTEHWLALKKVAAVFQTLTYTGTGADNLTPTGVGFHARLALVKGNNATIAPVREDDMAANTSMLVSAATGATDGIKSFGADTLVVGTNAVVNTNTVVYYGTFFNDYLTPPVSSGAGRNALLLGVG